MNLQNDNYYTALIVAAREGHGKCVDLLIQAGADVNIRDEWDRTALMMAVFPDDNNRCVKYFLKTIAQINLVNNDGENALTHHLMKINGIKEITMLLYAAGEAIDGTTVERKNYNGSIEQVPIPDYLLHKDLKLNLKHLAREAIRKHLIT